LAVSGQECSVAETPWVLFIHSLAVFLLSVSCLFPPCSTSEGHFRGVFDRRSVLEHLVSLFSCGTVLEVNGLLPPIGFGGERHCLEDCLWGICLAGGLRVEFRLGSCWNLHSVEQCSVCCVSRVALECDFSWGGCKRATCPFRTFRVLYWKPLCSRPVGAS